jgi:hypothetical protein
MGNIYKNIFPKASNLTKKKKKFKNTSAGGILDDL